MGLEFRFVARWTMPINPATTRRYFTIPIMFHKEAGAFRLIHDLSFPKGDSVNFSILRECCSVTYEDFDYFVSMLARVGQGCYIAKTDIESAFRMIPINPLDYHLLGFMIDNQYLL